MTRSDLVKAKETYHEQYLQEIKGAEDLLQLAKTRFSTHDGFNLASRAGDLQSIAARIDLLKDIILFLESDR